MKFVLDEVIIYAQECGGILMMHETFSVFFLFSFILSQPLNKTDLSSNPGDISQNPDLDFYQMIYGITVVVMVVLSALKGYTFTKVTLHASSKLHDTMFRRVRLPDTHHQHRC